MAAGVGRWPIGAKRMYPALAVLSAVVVMLVVTPDASADNGKWTAIEPPVPANASAIAGGSPSVGSVACSTSICVSSGTYYDTSDDQEAALWTESGGTWSAVEAPMPANAAGSEPDIQSVACSNSSCIAWGSYTDNGDNTEVGLWSESGGTWTSTEAPAPPNLRSGNYPSLYNGACSASTCVVTGQYLDAVAFEQDPAAWTESGGQWTVSELPPASNEITSGGNVGLVNGNYGGGPVTCSPSICVAFGVYETPDQGSGAYPYVLWTLSGGGWTAAETPLPADAGDPGPGGAISNVNSVACFIDACYADGYYYNNSGGDTSTYWSTSDGNWTTTSPPTASNGGTADPVTETSSIACSSDACLGVADSVLWTEMDGTWTTYTPPAPANASATNPDLAISPAVSCFAETCLGTGSYNDALGNNNAVLWLDSNGTWTTTEAPLPAGTYGTTAIHSVACSAAICVATGSAGFGPALWTEPVTNSAVTLSQGEPTSATVADGSGYSGQLTVTNASGAVVYTEQPSADSSDLLVTPDGAISASTTLAPGNYTIGGADSDAAGTTGTWTFTLTVQHVPATVSVIDDSRGVVTGGSFTYTATVTGSGGIVPTGAMTWTVKGPNGGSVPCTSTTGPTDGGLASYTCTIANANAGSYAATANYPGDPNYSSASAQDITASVAKAAPKISISDDSQPDPTQRSVTFTATVTGNGGLAPTGDVQWTVTAPGGATQGCDSANGPNTTGDGTTTYTCSIARAVAAEASASYQGDGNYLPVLASRISGISLWKQTPDLPGPTVATPVAGLPELMLYVETNTSLSMSGTASNIFIPPSVTAAPSSTFVVQLPTGSVTVGLATGTVVGPATLTADPPYPLAPRLAPLSLIDVLLGIQVEGIFVSFPVAKNSRTLTLTSSNVTPASFVGTFQDDKTTNLAVNDVILAGLVVVATNPVILTEMVAAAEAALDAEGLSIGSGVISDALSTVMARVAASARSVAASLIPVALVGRAGALWRSLTGAGAAAARAAKATATPSYGVPRFAHVLALRASDLERLRAMRLPGPLSKAAEQSLMTLPVQTTVGRLLASPKLPHVGGAVGLLAGDLAGRTAEMVISGPGYTAVRDVRVVHHLAGGRIVLPRGRHPGRWYAGIIDYSALRVSHGRVTGRAVLAATSWVTKR
jgi:hypothetical protein